MDPGPVHAKIVRDEFLYNDSLRAGWTRDLIEAAGSGSLNLGKAHVTHTVNKMLGLDAETQEKEL